MPKKPYSKMTTDELETSDYMRNPGAPQVGLIVIVAVIFFVTFGAIIVPLCNWMLVR